MQFCAICVYQVHHDGTADVQRDVKFMLDGTEPIHAVTVNGYEIPMKAVTSLRGTALCALKLHYTVSLLNENEWRKTLR